MSRWQEFGFPGGLKFGSPQNAVQGIVLAVKERLQPCYPQYAGEWYIGNNYFTNLFPVCSYAYAYPIEYGLERNYLSQGSSFPLRFPNNALINQLSQLPKVTLSGRTVHGFWDYAKEPSGFKEITEEEYLETRTVDQYGNIFSSAEDSCRFTDHFNVEIPEEFRFQNIFSERYLLWLYEKINPLKSYLVSAIREENGHFFYRYQAEPIPDLAFSD